MGMRRGNENGVIRFGGMPGDAPAAGISLGADYCAEHEQGITGLQALLGVGKLADRGIEKRQMTTWAKSWSATAALVIDDGLDLHFRVEPHAGEALAKVLEARPDLTPVTSPEGIVRLDGFPALDEKRSREYQFGRATRRLEVEPYRFRAAKTKAERAEVVRQTTGFYTAWDQNGFVVTARGAEPREVLQAMVDAYTEGTLVVSMGDPGNPFARGGINLLALDRVPANIRAAILEMDEDHLALMAAVDACGIKERLKAAGLQWSGLSPQMPNADRTEYGLAQLSPDDCLQFFLTPGFQLHAYGQVRKSDADSGWYSVRDLDSWIKGEGAVIKGSPEHQAAANRHMGADVLGRLRRALDPEGMAELDAAAEATGIPALARDGSLPVFALEPHWRDSPGGEVVFWVNPQGQQTQRLGWFTAPEMLQMAAGEGPGMKSAEVLQAMANAEPAGSRQLQMAQRSREEMEAENPAEALAFGR